MLYTICIVVIMINMDNDCVLDILDEIVKVYSCCTFLPYSLTEAY